MTTQASNSTNAANAYAVANPVPMAALPTTSGVKQQFLVDATNTGSSTYAPDGLAPTPIFGLGGQLLQGNEIVAGGIASLVSYVGPLLNASALCWVLIDCDGGAQQTAPATASEHAAQLGQVQSGAANFGVDTGVANAVVASLSPAVTALTDGMVVRVLIAASNTGATTLNLNGLGPDAVQGLAESALQGGELAAGGRAVFMWDATHSVWILLACEGGALQVSPAVKGEQAVQFGQLTALAGSSSNFRMDVASSTATATATADQIVVATALNGLQYLLSNFSETINLATTSVGGMDAGSAPASGYVALYAIFDPLTNASALLATNASTEVAPAVYGGGNMPAGFTASALVSVWPTNASKQFVPGIQQDRAISIQNASALDSTAVVGITELPISAIVPENARSISGFFSVSSTSESSLSLEVFESAAALGQQFVAANVAANTGIGGNFSKLKLSVAQNMFYASNSTGGVATFLIDITGYEI